MTFTNHDDGRTTVDDFPEQITVADELLIHADRSLLRRDTDRLYITPANGSAVYVWTDYDVPHLLSSWTRLYASIEDQK